MVRILVTRGRTVLDDVAVEQLAELLANAEIRVWVDLTGPLDEQSQRVVGDIFQFHPLAVEDCFAERERPKVESYEGYLYCITHGMSPSSNAEDHDIIELEAFLGERYLVTYHAKDSRSVEAVFQLVRRSGEPLRRGPASLLQTILDRQ